MMTIIQNFINFCPICVTELDHIDEYDYRCPECKVQFELVVAAVEKDSPLKKKDSK
jgi:uncharacterized Zn ribbon protein